ncbi:hypothetical protein AMAG_12857 [Allomyces macrogynus ATCC 38327]|uniref:G domain-containing protein n=1 Tax=Allomyces macrogynus (strain ATCC 38327) TaxID=578462 RepID=A0A0L0T1S4_ALLM3|nr:hypothetical protein AMAG_12857 [Allomyces macrogynus ATCC 38327]|eukprot:KNE68687.1 hypothetical protein AMAG_12857 [Allomyces macrogynus ATCC 38327]
MTNLQMPASIVLVGNPGAGKSSLLNALAGRIIFENGVSPGQGLTQSWKMHDLGNGTFIYDTPGILDAASAESTTSEVIKGLMDAAQRPTRVVVVAAVGDYPHLVKSDDIKMFRVLGSMLDRVFANAQIGIVFNKATSKTMAMIKADPALYLGELGNGQIADDTPICILPEIAHARDAELALLPVDVRDQLFMFFNKVPLLVPKTGGAPIAAPLQAEPAAHSPLMYPTPMEAPLVAQYGQYGVAAANQHQQHSMVNASSAVGPAMRPVPPTRIAYAAHQPGIHGPAAQVQDGESLHYGTSSSSGRLGHNETVSARTSSQLDILQSTASVEDDMVKMIKEIRERTDQLANKEEELGIREMNLDHREKCIKDDLEQREKRIKEREDKMYALEQELRHLQKCLDAEASRSEAGKLSSLVHRFLQYIKA